VVVAGAELGPVVDFPPDPKLHWQQFFLEHLQLSKDLHSIKKVLVLGHRDCGAYKKFKLLPEKDVDPEVERKAHEEQARKLMELIKTHQPELQFEAYLLDDTI
jgi:carbonic anhydrase